MPTVIFKNLKHKINSKLIKKLQQTNKKYLFHIFDIQGSIPMFLGDGAILRVFVVKDKMKMVLITTLVGPKHDRILSLVVQLLKIARVGK